MEALKPSWKSVEGIGALIILGVFIAALFTGIISTPGFSKFMDAAIWWLGLFGGFRTGLKVVEGLKDIFKLKNGKGETS